MAFTYRATVGVGNSEWVVHSVLSYVGSRSIHFMSVVQYTRLNYIAYANRSGFKARFNDLVPAW